MPNADACIATQALARAVEERLGRRVFVSAAEADVSVEGRIEKKKDAWHAVIHVRDAKGALLGTRELDRRDESCDAMSEPLALVIAVMIDPEAAMRPRPEPAAAQPAAATAPAATEPPPLPPAASSEAPKEPDRAAHPPGKQAEPWRFEGGGDVTIAQGLTPSPAVGAGVESILYPPGVPVGFRGFVNLFLPTTASKDDARASFDMLYAGGSICPTYRARVNVMGCLGGHLGILRPRAETPNRGISEDILPLWNAVAELRVSIPIAAPIGASIGGSAALPLLRPTFEYTAPGGQTAVLHKVSAVAFTGSAGLGFFFP
jgi:hypothetical protein